MGRAFKQEYGISPTRFKRCDRHRESIFSHNNKRGIAGMPLLYCVLGTHGGVRGRLSI